MRRLPLASTALAFSFVVFAFSPAHVSAATDDQNLTGLVYLADGTPLSAAPWADNTSFAVYVNHGGSWAAAWRYPAWPSWYVTSGGAYSIVLPAVEKDANWGNADPYRVDFDVSAITGIPGETDNATSHGTGDPGEFSTVGATENAIVWNATDNWQRWDVVLLALPDLAINASEVLVSPAPPVSVGTAVTVDATVRNLGAVDVADAVVRFTDGVPPGVPIGTDVIIPSLPAGGSVPVQRTWNAGPAGLHRLCVGTDPDGTVVEASETNNVACVDVLVTAAPETRPDYVPDAPRPLPPLRTGLSQPLSLSVQVLNQGNASGTATATIAFYNASTPGSPFSTALVPQLLPSEVSVRFAATWTSPATPGTYDVSANVDYGDTLPEWDETNNVFPWQVDVVTGPVTSLILGAPNVTAARTYVTSSTDLSFSVLDQGGSGIRSTWHRVDNGTWTNYTAAGPFRLLGEGPHFLEWYSEDFAGNVEVVQSAVLIVDDTPPITTPSVGDPKYIVGGTFVTSATPFSLAAMDGGMDPVGLASTEYRIDTGSWTPYAAPFTVSGEGAHGVALRSFDRLGNAEVLGILPVTVDDTPPITTPSVGEPKYVIGGTFVTSSTPISLSSQDGAPWPVGPGLVEYRIDGGSWNPYATPFTVNGEGARSLGVRAMDLLGNLEPPSTTEIIVDDTPPAPAVDVGDPKYVGLSLFITSATPIAMAAPDGGVTPVGLASLEYRVDGGGWNAYGAPTMLAGPDGDQTIDLRATDHLGNTATQSAVVVLDGTPPASTLSPASGPYTTSTAFTLAASDTGSGVLRTEYRVDGSPTWTPYTAAFRLAEGSHDVVFRSTDNLGNAEPERTMAISVEGAPVVPSPPNWKPWVATVFSVVLAALGIWSSRRLPTFRGRTNAGRTFFFTALPFVVAEAATGVASAMTGVFAIPPILGIGTITDTGILVAGALVSLLRVRTMRSSGS